MGWAAQKNLWSGYSTGREGVAAVRRKKQFETKPENHWKIIEKMNVTGTVQVDAL